MEILNETRTEVAQSSDENKESISHAVEDVHRSYTFNKDLHSDNEPRKETLADIEERLRVAERIALMRKNAKLPENAKLVDVISELRQRQESIKEYVALSEQTIEANKESSKKRSEDPRVMGEIEKEAYSEATLRDGSQI